MHKVTAFFLKNNNVVYNIIKKDLHLCIYVNYRRELLKTSNITHFH